MVSEAQTHPDTGRAQEGQTADGGPHRHRPPPRGGLRRLVTSATRLVGLQVRIWLTQVKLVMMRIAISTGLLLGAAVFGVLAVIFLCIGVFHVLTDVIGIPLWGAFLIFGGLLGLLALLLVLVATRMLTRKDPDPDDDTGEDKK